MTNNLTDEVLEMACLIQATHQNGATMSDEAAMRLALQAKNGVNPYQSFVYRESGEEIEGLSYKALVEHANAQGSWQQIEGELSPNEKIHEGLPEKAVAYRVWVRRDSNIPLFQSILKACLGEGWGYQKARDEALAQTATSGMGVVLPKEMYDSSGNVKTPPVDASWHVTAKRRGLRLAIYNAFGSPTKGEWLVDGVKTTIEDWQNVSQIETRSPSSHARAARHNAVAREAVTIPQMRGEERRDLLWGDDGMID